MQYKLAEDFCIPSYFVSKAVDAGWLEFLQRRNTGKTLLTNMDYIGFLKCSVFCLKFVVFWYVTTCNLFDMWQRFGGICRFFLQKHFCENLGYNVIPLLCVI